MNNLLLVQASLFGGHGQSSQLAARFLSQWRARHTQGRVVVRDLNANPVPHLTSEHVQAFGAAPSERTPAQLEAVALSDQLIGELQSATDIVFAMPMYNFSVPSTVRAYFDHIARAGVTFRYTDQGPEGLLKNKRTYVLTARGGIYADDADTQTAYLRQFLGFIGLTDVTFIHAQGLAMGELYRDQGIAQAHAAIDALQPATSAAA